MKAKLILQEGPGAGRSYPLDPSKQIRLSVGRSADCNIVLQDHRASRYHADIRWTNGRWAVVDRDSTNGTYVNGLRVRRPHDLRVGDRVSIGETTFVVREWGTRPPAPIPDAFREPGERRSRERAPAQARTTTGYSVAFWLVQGLVMLAVVMLASGAFLPWLEVSGSLSQDMEPIIQSITEIVSSIMGESFLFVSQEVSGLEGYGKLTLGLALIATVALVVDFFLSRESPISGIVYLLAGLLAAGAMAADLKNLYDVYRQVESVSLLFGIKLSQVIEVFDQFIEVKVTPLPGLYLTGAGLLVLIGAGIGRLLMSLLERRARGQ